MRKGRWLLGLAGMIFMGMNASNSGGLNSGNLSLQTVLPTFLTDIWYHFIPADSDNAYFLDTDIAQVQARALEEAREDNWPLDDFDVELELKQRAAARAALVLLSNPGDVLPLSAGQAFRLVRTDEHDYAAFKGAARRYAPYQEMIWQGAATFRQLEQSDPDIPTVVLLDDSHSLVRTEGNDWWQPLLRLADRMPLIFIHYGPSGRLASVDVPAALLTVPLCDRVTQQLTAESLFGANEINNRLDHRIGERFPAGHGLYLPASRLQYGLPEEVGIDRKMLGRVDQVVSQAIRSRATPGCQLLVARHGKVIYQKSYGYHTYGREQAVRNSDLYDVASVTKAMATTLGMMKLYDEEEVQLSGKLGDYLPEFQGRAGGRLSLKQLLAHHSGMQPNLPIHQYLRRSPAVFHDEASEAAPHAIGPGTWLENGVPSTILSKLPKLPLGRATYGYSDVNFVLLQNVIERQSGQSMEDYLHTAFYSPLGLLRTAFNPTLRYPSDHLVPTQLDNYWRGGLLRGYVHDEGAALLGGVAGHAGLFANAADMAVLCQMLLNGGSYGGQQYLQPETVEAFTARNGLNYRGLGFDRLEGGYRHLLQYGASADAFGHTGFTGTCVWADPDNGLIYIFLANRIHPDSSNDTLLKQGIRSRIHRTVYQSLNTYEGPEA